MPPFEAAQISLPGFGLLIAQQHGHRRQVTFIPFGEGAGHVPHIQEATIFFGIQLNEMALVFGLAPLPEDQGGPENQKDCGRGDQRSHGGFAPAPAPHFFRAAGWPGEN